MAYAYKEGYEEQFHWCRERDSILEKMEVKLYEMKHIAEYAYIHGQELTLIEINRLNDQLNELKSEVSSLENQLYFDLH